MRKIIIPISALLITGTLQAQLTTLPNTENYIQSKTYLDYNGTTATKSLETVQYFDGLGRPKQIVNVKASPLGKDVVTPIEYDPFGRQVKDYLPVPQGSTLNGAITPNPLSNLSSSPYGNEKIYSEKVLENSPLDRILEQKQVGNDWNGKSVKFEYAINIGNDAYKFVPTTVWENGATKTTLTVSAYDIAGMLYRNMVTDEDGNRTYEYRNGQGQTILVRKMISDTEYADTYYVYNEYNQLAFVLPPKAINQSLTDDLLNTLCYQYRYDGMGRLVEKKIPGKGWEYMVYDKADRLVGTQDAELRAKGQWLYTKYDQFGRVAITGICTGGGRYEEQDIVNGYASNNVNRIDTPFFERQGMNVYYNNPDTSYPNASKWVTLLSLHYHDSYPAYGFNPVFPSTIQGEPVLTEAPTSDGRSTKGLPVMSLVKNIEDDNWTKNYTYYDQKGRVIGGHSVNHLGGYTHTESKLDFAGVIKQTITKHKRLDSDTERVITETFDYDNQNRLLIHKHQVDNNPTEILAQNIYNEISQITNKKVGGTDLAVPLQSIDYQYNIRGWLTRINDPASLNGKLFGYEIKYNNPVYTNLATGKYNGNIAEVDWRNASEGALKRYSYTYDPLNRLKDGIYTEPGATNPYNNNFNENLTYDLNGNIMTLKRNAYPVSGTTATQVDDLEYKYIGNRLNQVIENSPNSSGYEGGNNIIGYDLNGNMTDMKDKGVQSIKYNHLNLPISIGMQFTNPVGNISTTNISHLYRADGVKLRKTYSQQAHMGLPTIRMTDYLDGFQYSYEDDGGICMTCKTESAYEAQAYSKFKPVIPPVAAWKLDFVGTLEGFYSFAENRYIYNYKDHLGNTRVTFAKNNAGVVQSIDTNNYYPFGLNHIGGSNYSNFGSYYNYKYNGKELQETGMYDYGARMYMADLGRWGVIDPLAEVNRAWSPYRYAYNNPLRFIDPDGRLEDWYQDNQTGNIAWHDGSAERPGETNLTATGNTRVFGIENGQTVQEFNLNSDGSFTANGYKVSNGESVTTLVGSTITSKQGFDLIRYLSHLGNEGGYFYSNAGGSGIGQHSPFFRPEIDKVIDLQGFAGGMLTPLAIGQFNPLMDRLEALLGVQVQAFGLIDPVNALTTDNKTYEVSGNQSVGLNVYRGDGNSINGVGVKTQYIYKGNMTRAQRDSMINKFNADEIKFDKQADSLLRKIQR